MNRIQFALCGSYSSEEELNPYKATEPPVRQEILSLINLGPQAPEGIAEKLGLSKEEVIKHLEALTRPGLVERVGQKFKVSFAIFTPQDQGKLRPLLEELSQSFAKVVEENMDSVRNTHLRCGFPDHGFSFEEMACILVGAYTLDYGGLRALSEAGFLLASKPMPGGNYIFTGLEGGPNLRANWQWGHSCPFGKFTFFGHGELPREGPRRAFPEEAYKWFREGRSMEEVTATMEELGEVLLALYERPLKLEGLAARTELDRSKLQSHLELLRELEYVEVNEGVYVSRCPVIGEDELKHIWELAKRLQGDLITKVIRPGWDRIEHIYRETAPAGNGIDIREAFNLLYHLIFEKALQMLMEGGVIPQPRRHSDGARYAVWMVAEMIEQGVSK